MVDGSENLPIPEGLTGQGYHVMSEGQREKGNFTDAIESAQKAFGSYFQEGNISKASEAKASEMLSHRHLFESTGDHAHLDNARTAIEKSVSILKDNSEKKGLGTAYYNLAKFYQTSGEGELAISTMRNALKAFEDAPDDPMGFPAHIAEIKTRLSAFEYSSGDDDALNRFEIALENLRSNPHPDEYSQGVWESGAYMHMAEACKKRGETEKALGYLDKATEVIGENEGFKLRRNQIEKIRSQI